MTMPDTLRDLSRRMDEVDRQLERVENVVGTKADGSAVVRELDWIRGELKSIRTETAAAILRADSTANDVIRSGRSETMKLLLASMTAFATLLGLVVAAYATGKI